MSVKYVMAWDPGNSTGVCVGALDVETPSGFRVVESVVILWPNRFSKIRALLDRYRPPHTVVESFRLYRHKASEQVGSDFPSVQVIGIIESFCFVLGIAMPIYQPAALIAGKPPVQILPEHANLLGPTEHHKDSYKHLRYYIEHQKRLAKVGGGGHA